MCDSERALDMDLPYSHEVSRGARAPGQKQRMDLLNEIEVIVSHRLERFVPQDSSIVDNDLF